MLNITGSTFTGNTADDDAGHAAFLTITGGSFSENRGVFGGAVAVAGAAVDAVNLVVTGTLFQANKSEQDGGAIRSITDGGVLIKSAKFFSNVAASDGGAVSLDAPTGGAGTRTVVGSLFRANVAADDAGGMDVFEATTITSCLFTGNTANHVSGDGGGLRLFSGVSTITKSVISGNFGATGGGIFNAVYGSTIDAATKVTGNAARTDPNKRGI